MAEGKKPAQSTRLVQIALDADLDLFHGVDDRTYADIPTGGHRETWPIRGQSFRRWLTQRYYEIAGTVPGAQGVQDALAALDGIAQFESPMRDVHIRLAEHEGAIYLDLVDAEWRAIQITAEGWEVVSDPPVRFRRARGMLPLPQPVTGGRLDELREFVNVADEDWPLLASWEVATLRPRGPFPVLPVHGEQGSAKSTVSRVLRELVDPNVAALRFEPRSGRDLMIAAANGWILCFDNLSAIPDWLSDAFCRISTGGGFSTRELHTDMEEVLIDVQRPLLLNGIAELTTRADLLDRSIPLYLPRLQSWIPEDAFLAAFEAARPRILGALLDAVVEALRRIDKVEFSAAVRMSDYAKWATAAEAGLGLEPGAFIRAYAGNRAQAVEITLDAAPIYGPLRGIAAEGFTGSATELLKKLSAGEEARPEGWPRTPAVLGTELRRLAPVLRRVGIEVDFGREGGRRQIVISMPAATNGSDRGYQLALAEALRDGRITPEQYDERALHEEATP